MYMRDCVVIFNILFFSCIIMTINILQLPDEIIIKILKYLDGADKIVISEVCRDFKRIGTDRDVLQCLDFTKNYKLTLRNLKSIGRKVTAPFVTYLNLNGVHWIPSAALRDAIIKFASLNTLYVVDTQLFVKDLAEAIDALTLMKKLAFSLKSDSCGDIFKIEFNKNLTHLYLTYNSRSVRPMIHLLGQIEELEELWLIEPKRPSDKINTIIMLPWLSLHYSLPKVSKKVVCTRLYGQIWGEDDFFNKLKDPNKKWSTQNVSSHASDETLFRIDEALDGQEVGIPSPKNKISTLSSTSDPDVSRYTNYMKRRKCDSKEFWRKPEDLTSKGAVQPTLFKKPRIGLNSTNLDDNYVFKQFTERTLDLEEFEIDDMDPHGVKAKLWSIEDLISTKNWNVLKKLTITSVSFHSGKFLLEITKNCQMLSCLKIQDELVQDNITINLCEALPFATNLKDFRYQRKGSIPVDNLIESLTKCSKLERLCIQCRNTSKISKKPLETFIVKSVNLVFLFIYISELYEKECVKIRQGINELGLKHNQIICFRGNAYEINNICYEDIPSCHIEEIVCQQSHPSYDYVRTFFSPNSSIKICLRKNNC